MNLERGVTAKRGKTVRFRGVFRVVRPGRFLNNNNLCDGEVGTRTRGRNALFRRLQVITVGETKQTNRETERDRETDGVSEKMAARNRIADRIRPRTNHMSLHAIITRAD